MATQVMHAMGPYRTDTMRAPSPTLTNPDMVLPNEPIQFPAISSPSRRAWMERPPSPSYLRDKTAEHERERSNSSGSGMTTPKREKRGLMSRKMMLLRSRTASNGLGVNGAQPALRNVSSEAALQDHGSVYASSPTLIVADHMNYEQQQPRRASASGSSVGSEDMSQLPQFLAKYEQNGVIGTDDDFDSDSPAPQKLGYSVSDESNLDARRRQQEEDEHNSAVLSKRAEEILANAKKRLNLMEGNLRGARDLVQPLTAANLKRATSVGSSYVSSGTQYGGRRLYTQNDYHYEPATPQPHRKLQAQASSPTIGKDYHAHWRGFSETEMPDRPYTALERTNTPISFANGRLPTKTNEPPGSNALRGSRSYDSLGGHALRRPMSRDPAYTRGSPDLNLEPLVEQDGHDYTVDAPSSISSDRSDGLGIYRPASRTDDLREQMSSLKGKISTLRERAREDSLRRQSMQNLREPSPLNNATINAPEFFYTSSQAYGSPVLDTNAGVGWSQNSSPVTPQGPQKAWEPGQLLTGSRNAFAEQARTTHHQAQGSDGSSRRSPRTQAKSGENERPQQPSLHRRTPSGTAIVQSSKHRYSHHQQYHARDGSEGRIQQPSSSSTEIGAAQPNSEFRDLDENSEPEASVYEDAESEQPPAVVAHEDREDAFDYETFFLHSAMGGSYPDAVRRASASSEDTVSSAATARGPTAPGAEQVDLDDVFEDENYPPATPETPERLKEIERNLHKRTFSDESVSTMASFATAIEGQETPTAASKRSSVLDWPIRSEPVSRPSTAIPIKRPSPIANSDTSSDRADSGVGLPHRPNSSQSSKRSPLGSLKPKSSFSAFSTATTAATNTLSPPISPRAVSDPATVIVNALLDPAQKPLELKDKALLFGLVERLRNVCQTLQDREEGKYESRMLRRRLDDARRVLDGALVPRPGTT